MIKVLIFDFDGVIVESVDIKTNAFAKLFESEGSEIVEKVEDYHRAHTGVSRYDKFRYIYRNFLRRELTDATFEELCMKFSKLVVDDVVGAPYVPGAREFLENSFRRYRCVVSSATPQSEIEEIVEKRNMRRYFAALYGAPEEKKRIVQKALSVYRATPRETVSIGDALSDYEAASSNGVRFIARVTESTPQFEDIDCVKVKDLTGLQSVLEDVERS